jgi:hypothetical protein
MMTFRHVVFVLLTLNLPVMAAAPFSDGKTPSSNIFVATNGNDSTGNGSSAQPFRTISRGVSAAGPGTAVTIRRGVYGGDVYVEGLAGTAAAPIWIRGESATNRPILQGGGEGLHLVRTRYVVVENLEITASTQNGMNCDDGGEYDNPEASRFLVFSNLYIHHIGSDGNQDGLKLSGLYDYWVLNSEFAFCGGADSGSGVDHVGCHRGIIEACYFHDLSANAVQCKGGSSDIEIRRCRIIHAGQRGINIGGSTGFEFFRPPLSTSRANYEAADIRVFANIFQGCTASVAYVGCVTSIVANNTIVTPTRWIARILQETTTSPPYEFLPCGNNRFDNNIVYFNSSLLNTHVNVGGNTAPETFTYANNLWYAYNNPAASTPSLQGTVTNNKTGINPLLANPAQSNYSITMSSQATTNGRFISALSADHANQSFLNPPSIGAFEISGDADTDTLPDAWEIRHLGTAAYNAVADPDDDHYSNHEEYIADTYPGDPHSLLCFSDFVVGSNGNLTVRWRGGSASTQYVDRLHVSLDGSNDWTTLFTNRPPTALTNEIVVQEVMTGAVYRIRAGRF